MEAIRSLRDSVKESVADTLKQSEESRRKGEEALRKSQKKTDEALQETQKSLRSSGKTWMANDNLGGLKLFDYCVDE